MSQSCKLMDVVCQVPSAMQSDCEIYFCTICLLSSQPDCHSTAHVPISSVKQHITSTFVMLNNLTACFFLCDNILKISTIKYQFTTPYCQYYAVVTNETKTLLVLNTPLTHLAVKWDSKFLQDIYFHLITSNLLTHKGIYTIKTSF